MPASVRSVEVPQAEDDVAKATAIASNLQELISTIPYAYQVKLGDYLTRKYRLAHKHANVTATLAAYNRHKTDGSFPPLIRSSLKEPKLQFAKEFLATSEGALAPETFKNQIQRSRKELLDTAISCKNKELSTLSDKIQPEVDTWRTLCSEVVEVNVKDNGGRIEKGQDGGPPRFLGLPATVEKEWKIMFGACKTYTYRVLALARAAIDRAELQKLSKLQLKETTDVEMTGVDAREPAMRDVIREELKAFRKEMSQAQSMSPTVKRRRDPLLTPYRGPLKKAKRSDTEEQRLSWEESEAVWWEQKEGQGEEISIDSYLAQCSRKWRPWAPDTFPNVYCVLGQRDRNKLNAAFSREWELDTAWSAKPGVFKFHDVYIPEDIEYMLAVNHKYILHSKPQDHDVEEAKRKFIRTVRIRYQFRDKPSNPEYIPQFHVGNPTWEPQKASKAIELGLDRAVKVIDHQVGLALSSAALQAPRQRNLNWTRVQMFLTENSLITKLTDKNLGLAVFPKQWYVEEIEKMLADDKVYQPVPAQRVEQLRGKISQKLSQWRLPKSMDKFVRQKTEFRIPEFHAIPKVHKTPWALRPIVPSHSWVTSRVSEVIDYLCRPLLENMPWVVNSTKQVVNNLSQVRANSDNVWICTGDVVAFYTNIDALECAAVVAGAWKRYFPESKIDKNIIAKMIRFVMENNFFQFQDQMYQQIDGLAMGTACAPLLANIYAAFYERKQRVLYQKGVLLYNRYIDDILMIFHGTEKDLNGFLNTFELGSLTVKWDYSSMKKEFLDVEVMRVRDLRGWRIATRLFKKEMNRHLYIPWSSAHPQHVKKAFVKAELIRLAIVSSEVGYFADARIQFYGNLRRRGYPSETLENWFSQVSYDNRPRFLLGKEEETEVPLMLSGQYNPVWEYINVGEVIREARREWIQEKNLPVTLEQPLIRSLRRQTSLFDLLSTWNKTVLHPIIQSSETAGVKGSTAVPE